MISKRIDFAGHKNFSLVPFHFTFLFPFVYFQQDISKGLIILTNLDFNDMDLQFFSHFAFYILPS